MELYAAAEQESITMYQFRSEQLRTAATKGDTKTVAALLARGADCKDDDGYGFSGCILVSSVCHSAGRKVRQLAQGGAARSACFAVQLDGAALCVEQGQDGDNAGAGQDGRKHSLQGQDGVRFSDRVLVPLVCHSSGRTVRPVGVELQECLLWLCRWTALHLASLNGHTATAMELVKAGADVHCKTNEGCGSRAASSCRWGLTVRGGRSVHSLGCGAAGAAVLAVQEDGAALCVAQRPHGDGAGAGQGGRGRALQGQIWVRFYGSILVLLG